MICQATKYHNFLYTYLVWLSTVVFSNKDVTVPLDNWFPLFQNILVLKFEPFLFYFQSIFVLFYLSFMLFFTFFLSFLCVWNCFPHPCVKEKNSAKDCACVCSLKYSCIKTMLTNWEGPLETKNENSPYSKQLFPQEEQLASQNIRTIHKLNMQVKQNKNQDLVQLSSFDNWLYNIEDKESRLPWRFTSVTCFSRDQMLGNRNLGRLDPEAAFKSKTRKIRGLLLTRMYNIANDKLTWRNLIAPFSVPH